MDWAKNGKIWKKITKFIVRLTREREKKFEKFWKIWLCFLNYFFQKKHQIGPVHFRPKNKIATWQMLGVEFFFKLEFDGGCMGVQHVRSNFFFFLGRPKFLWSWHISGSFGQNFRVLMEETFARTGLEKKNRPQALNQAVLMAQSLSFFFGHQRVLVAGFLQFFL